MPFRLAYGFSPDFTFEHRSPLDRGAGGSDTLASAEAGQGGTECSTARAVCVALSHVKRRGAVKPPAPLPKAQQSRKAGGRGRTRPPQTAKGDGTPDKSALLALSLGCVGLRIGEGTTTFPPMSDL